MSEKVNVTLKVEGMVRALMEACAQADRRTLSAYVESLVVVDAKTKGIQGEGLVFTKDRKGAAANLPLTLPDFVDPDVWNDFLKHREELKKPLKGKGLTYLLHELTTAHKNGWEVNDLLAKAISSGWAGVVFEKHKTTRGDGQEPVKPMTTQEYLKAKEEIQQRLLCHAGISGSNRGRFADPSLIEVLINQLLGEELSTAYATLDGLITDFYKKGTSVEENNARIQEMLK